MNFEIILANRSMLFSVIWSIGYKKLWFLSTVLPFLLVCGNLPSSLSSYTVSQTSKSNESLVRSEKNLLSGDAAATSAIHCNGTLYHRELKPLSCADAVEQIPSASRNAKFQVRGPGVYDVSLPQRYISRQ